MGGNEFDEFRTAENEAKGKRQTLSMAQPGESWARRAFLTSNPRTVSSQRVQRKGGFCSSPSSFSSPSISPLSSSSSGTRQNLLCASLKSIRGSRHLQLGTAAPLTQHSPTLLFTHACKIPPETPPSDLRNRNHQEFVARETKVQEGALPSR